MLTIVSIKVLSSCSKYLKNIVNKGFDMSDESNIHHHVGRLQIYKNPNHYTLIINRFKYLVSPLCKFQMKKYNLIDTSFEVYIQLSKDDCLIISKK